MRTKGGVARCCCPTRGLTVKKCDPCAWDFTGRLYNTTKALDGDDGFFKRCITQGRGECPVRQFYPTTVSIEGEFTLDNPTGEPGRVVGVEINASERNSLVGCPARDNLTFVRALIGEADATDAATLGVAVGTIIFLYERNDNDSGLERVDVFSLDAAGGYVAGGQVKLTFSRVTGNEYDIVASYAATTIVSERIDILWYDPMWHNIAWSRNTEVSGPGCNDYVEEWHTLISPCVICSEVVSGLGDTGELQYWYPDAAGNAIPQLGNLMYMEARGGAVSAVAGGINGLQFAYGIGGYHTLIGDLIDYGQDFTVFFWAAPSSGSVLFFRYGPMSGDYDEGNPTCPRAPSEPFNDAFTFQDDNFALDTVNVTNHAGQITVESLCGLDYTIASDNLPVQAPAYAKSLYVFNYRVLTQDWLITVGDGKTLMLDSRVIQKTPAHDFWLKQKSPFSTKPQFVNQLTLNYGKAAIGSVDQPGFTQKSLRSGDLEYLWNGGAGNVNLLPILG